MKGEKKKIGRQDQGCTALGTNPAFCGRNCTLDKLCDFTDSEVFTYKMGSTGATFQAVWEVMAVSVVPGTQQGLSDTLVLMYFVVYASVQF